MPGQLHIRERLRLRPRLGFCTVFALKEMFPEVDKGLAVGWENEKTRSAVTRIEEVHFGGLLCKSLAAVRGFPDFAGIRREPPALRPRPVYTGVGACACVLLTSCTQATQALGQHRVGQKRLCSSLCMPWDDDGVREFAVRTGRRCLAGTTLDCQRPQGQHGIRVKR